ncbi:MAG: 1-acyl-sn-glycerol-3-phosphate acyltransferase [Candidatus Delongbacteria bacterium]|nr:1-acyl-sn-glycerol-3-phosphate acyltransferase [Candidatus Delongbacteria bacterium]
MTTATTPPVTELYELHQNRFVFHCARFLIKCFALLYFCARSQGRENYPAPPYLVVFNHSSNLDTVALSLAVNNEVVSAWAKESLFRTPLIRWWVKRLGFVPVRRGEQDERSINTALAYLKGGGIFFMAPEGTRRRSLEVPPRPRTGVVRLAQLADVPIVPVGVSGTFKALPPGKSIPRPRRLAVRVGKPFRLPPLVIKPENYKIMQEQAQLVVDKIYELVED